MRERFEMLFQNLDADSTRKNDRDESKGSIGEVPQKRKYLTDFFESTSKGRNE
jgi:hypothetical protein